MFEWLSEELASIHTSKFHLIEGGDGLLQEAIRESELGLADDYKTFVVKYGNSRFFRQSLFGYRLGVMAGPQRVNQNSSAYRVGYDNGEPIHLRNDCEGVFGRNLKKPVADSFGSWFEGAYQRIKKKEYSNSDWIAIKEGPQAFDAREEAVVEARKKFTWNDVGLDETGNRLIEITNDSDIRIPCLTLGVRSRDGNLNGAVIVEVMGLSPRMTQVFAIDCYKQYYAPVDLKLFDIPRPGPEDRDYLAELKRLHS